MKAGSDWFLFWRLAFQMRRAFVSISLSTQTESEIKDKCNKANTNRETGENTFLKLVSAMVFWKLVKIKDMIQYLCLSIFIILFH